MKSILYFLIYLIAFLPLVHGQRSQLVLTNKSSQIIRAIESGKTIRVKMNENLRLKGELNIIDSATIAIGNDRIPISEIVSIKARTVDSRGSGIVLIALGTGVFVFGVAFTEEINVEGGVGLCILGVGMTAGGIKKLTVGQTYISEKWRYSIR